MPIPGYQQKHSFIRIISGNGFYVDLVQYTNPDWPTEPPRTSTGRQLDSGRMSNNVITFTEDEGVPFDPITTTFDTAVLPNQIEMLNAFSNAFNKSPWVIGGDTWQGFATNNIGQRLDSEGNAWDCLYPQDASLRNRMVAVVMQLAVPNDAPGGSPFFTRYDGVAFHTPSFRRAENVVMCQFQVEIWGGINNNLTDWPAGLTESTPT